MNDWNFGRRWRWRLLRTLRWGWVTGVGRDGAALLLSGLIVLIVVGIAVWVVVAGSTWHPCDMACAYGTVGVPTKTPEQIQSELQQMLEQLNNESPPSLRTK